MTTSKKTKTEHSGAKNGGGYWGTREEAKTIVGLFATVFLYSIYSLLKIRIKSPK